MIDVEILQGLHIEGLHLPHGSFGKVAGIRFVEKRQIN